MPRHKLKRMQEIATFSNVLAGEEIPASEWLAERLNTSRPLTLELGCGKGEYTLALAERFPARNFVGVDFKGERLYHGAHEAQRRALDNVAFVRIRVEHLLRHFRKGRVAEIWLPFPDPYPKRGSEHRRLTSAQFLDIYRDLLLPGGLVHFKTDDDRLYHFTLATLRDSGAKIVENYQDVKSAPEAYPASSVRSKYELRYRMKQKPIKYISFCFEQ